MGCCKNILSDQPHNEDLDMRIAAPSAGTYKAILNYIGAKIVKEIDLDLGADIIVPRPFNENYLYTMQIIQPDGTALSVDDCALFQFQTYININKTCNNDTDCDDNPPPTPYS